MHQSQHTLQEARTNAQVCTKDRGHGGVTRQNLLLLACMNIKERGEG